MADLFSHVLPIVFLPFVIHKVKQLSNFKAKDTFFKYNFINKLRRYCLVLQYRPKLYKKFPLLPFIIYLSVLLQIWKYKT